MGEGPEKRRAGMIGKRKYGAEEEEGHLSVPARPFCCPCNCSGTLKRQYCQIIVSYYGNIDKYVCKSEACKEHKWVFDEFMGTLKARDNQD